MKRKENSWRSKFVASLIVHRLAERLLEKESINLPEIIEVIGDRPFEMKESIKNYLNEMRERQEQEAAEAAAEADKEKESERAAEKDDQAATESPKEPEENSKGKEEDKK